MAKTVTYRGTQIPLPTSPRTGVCICKHTKPIRRTDIHHWRYAYTVKEVLKDPAKALENTVEVCMYHHKLAANSMRKITEAKIEDLIRLTNSMDAVTKQKWLTRLSFILKHCQ